MIELINERHLSDWSAIYNTPDSRLYKRLIEQQEWAQAHSGMRRPESTGELLLLREEDAG